MDILGGKEMEWLNFSMSFILIFLCFATFFDFLGRVMEICGQRRFEFVDDFEDAQIDDGDSLIRAVCVCVCVCVCV